MTPNELEQGRALLAKATEAPWGPTDEEFDTGDDSALGSLGAPPNMSPYKTSLLSEGLGNGAFCSVYDRDVIVWLRNHAAELLADSAALADCEKVRADTVTLFEKSEAALEDSRAHADRLAEELSISIRDSDDERRIGELLAAHAARRQKEGDGE